MASELDYRRWTYLYYAFGLTNIVGLPPGGRWLQTGNVPFAVPLTPASPGATNILRILLGFKAPGFAAASIAFVLQPPTGNNAINVGITAKPDPDGPFPWGLTERFIPELWMLPFWPPPYPG